MRAYERACVRACVCIHSFIYDSYSLPAAPCPYEQVPGQVGYFRSIDSPTEIQHCVQGMVFLDPPCECVQVGQSKSSFILCIIITAQPNCTLYGTNVTFCTNVEHINTTICGYRAISNFALDGISGHFSTWPLLTYFLIS